MAHLGHQLESYWQNVAEVLQIANNLQDELFKFQLNDAIQTANENSQLYGLIRSNPDNSEYKNNYYNNEIMFYNQLNGLIVNHIFLNNLREAIQIGMEDGVQYFLQFRQTVGL
jgi:hypothetical protein